jgi:hypothetical protein
VKLNADFKALVEIALHQQMEQFVSILYEHNIPGVSSILACLDSSNNVVIQTFNLFKSPKLIESYLRDNFHYIPPTTVPLGKGSFQFIPPSKILKKVLADKTFQKMRQGSNNISAEQPDGFLLEDICDGLAFKENKFFISNPTALREMFT